jgi:heme-degrading monooxygenase HmoA
VATILEFVRLFVEAEDEVAFLRQRPAAIAAIQEACSGFRSASLYRAEEEPGVWFDVVLWDSLEEAKAASGFASELQPVAAWLEHIDELPSSDTASSSTTSAQIASDSYHS